MIPELKPNEKIYLWKTCMELEITVYSKQSAVLELYEKGITIGRLELTDSLAQSLLKGVAKIVENRIVQKIDVREGRATFSSFRVACILAHVVGWYYSIPVYTHQLA